MPALRRFAVPLAAALLCAACAVPTAKEPGEKIEMPPAWRTPSDSGASLAEWPFGTLFRDSELERFLEEALRNNRDLRIAAQRVELARAQYGIQEAALWPTIAAEGDVLFQRYPSPQNADKNSSSTLYRAGLIAPPWEIDLWGRLRSLSDAALRNVESNAALQRFVQVGLVSRIAAGWIDLLEIDRALEIAQGTALSRTESLRIVRMRFDAGVVSMVDVTQAETSLAQAQAAIAQLQLRRSLRENALTVLAGRSPGPMHPTRKLGAYALPATLPAGIPSALLTRRPDVRAAELALAGAQANVEAARLAFLPSISLTGFLGLASPQLSQLVGGERFGYTLLPAITLPLFDGGRLASNLQANEAQQRIAYESYALTTQEALREVEDALVRFARLRDERDAMNRIIAAGTERLRLVRLRYVNGISSYFEVLDSERQLFDAELQQTRLSAGMYVSVVDLYRALGGGWQPE